MLDIYPIKVTLKKNNINQDEIKEQKVIILGTLNMLKNLDYNKNIQFGMDFIYKLYQIQINRTN